MTLLFAVVACGGSSITPLAPTALPPDSPAAPAPLPPGASIRGTVTDGGGSAGFVGLTAGMTVTVVGTSISTRVGSDGRFSLENVPTGDVQLRFEGPGADATLAVSGVQAGETINLTVAVSGSTAAVENQARESGTRVEVEGRIESISPADRTFVVAGRSVRVTDLARKVERHAEDDNDDDDDDNEEGEVEVRGAISGLAGGCPSLSFSVGSQRVATNAATRFEHTAYGELRNGMTVEAEGARQPDGSILAKKVKRE